MKKTMTFLFAAFFSAVLFAQNKIIPMEYGGLNLEIFTLKNGLTVFAVQDKNSALVNSEFVCKAGFSSQSPSTCGFFSMYSRILTEMIHADDPDFFELSDFKSECKSESSNYTSTFPPEELEHHLNVLSKCLSNPVFDDEPIEKVLMKMKKESSDYASSTAGFINTSIDSRVFSKSPWKHDSGIYPAVFSDYSIPQARTILCNIRSNHYVPENCALFISGNITPDFIFEAAEKELSSWKGNGKKTPVNFKNENDNDNEETQGRKFVLVSDDFSKDMTQIIVQFTDLDETKCNILAAAMNEENSAYKKILSSEKKLCIMGTEYLAAASAKANGTNRLILQSLLETPIDGNSILEQAGTFIELSKQTASLSPMDFTNAQKEIFLKFRMKSTGGKSVSELLASYWPESSWTTPEEFYGDFLNSIDEFNYENANEISKSVNAENPFVFLLVNTENFKSQKKQFEESGYEKIDESNSSWWKKEMLSENAKAEKKLFFTPETNKKTSIVKSRPSEYFYSNSVRTLKEKKLINGIPVLIKQNSSSETACISIAIKGGMLSSPAKEKNLRTILVADLAKKMKIYGAKAETRETVSYLTFEVPKENFMESLKKFINVLIYDDIKPVQADRLFAEENYRIFTESADLGFQMKQNVFAYLYRNTKLGLIYRDYDNENNSASYQSLLAGRTELLDASLYSIVICGDVEMEKAFSQAEETFGILRQQKKPEEHEFDFPKPAWKNKERKVQLRHIYSSDLPPELAPKESPVLIPTKEFLDPVQIYFAAPEDKARMEKFNALLMELSSRMNGELGSLCVSYKATKLIPVGYISGSKIKSTGNFMKIFRKHRKILLEELKDNEKQEKTLRTIKSRHEVFFLRKTSTNEGTAMLLQESIINENPADYLDRYLEIENSSANDFYKILEEFIPEIPLMKVHSVDGK